MGHGAVGQSGNQYRNTPPPKLGDRNVGKARMNGVTRLRSITKIFQAD